MGTTRDIVRADSLEVLEHVRATRTFLPETFDIAAQQLQREVDHGTLLAVGNHCLLGTRKGEHSNPDLEAAAALIEDNSDRFIASVFLLPNVFEIPPTATIKYSLVEDTRVWGSPIVEDAELYATQVSGNARIESSRIQFGMVIGDSSVTNSSIRNVNVRAGKVADAHLTR